MYVTKASSLELSWSLVYLSFAEQWVKISVDQKRAGSIIKNENRGGGGGKRFNVSRSSTPPKKKQIDTSGAQRELDSLLRCASNVGEAVP